MPEFFLTVPGLVALAGLAALIVHGRLGRPAARLQAGSRASSHFVMQAVISLVVLATALYVVVARPEAADDHKWAYGVIGTIIGYWLRPGRS